MHRLLYYPNFEIQDENFLKFALLYIDEIRPIIPRGVESSLSGSMKDIIKSTDLIKPYAPDYTQGDLASEAAIKHLEQRAAAARYDIECKRELYRLLKKVFVACAATVACVYSGRNMCVSGKDNLDFWGNMGNVGVCLDTLKHTCYGAEEYIKRVEGKLQARKYLAILKQLRPDSL